MNGELCTACPRKCNTDRSVRPGSCGAGSAIRIARVGLHPWEEPCISYGKGSGTIFFSGCNLRCVFCQNHEISHQTKGREVDAGTLAREMLKLRDRGAANINLVTPSHYTERIREALLEVKPELGIPVVYNSSGYDSIEALRRLEGLVDIYLPDLKYRSEKLSSRYSGAADYFAVAAAALEEMYRQRGYAVFDGQGHMTGGVLMRHMVLPGCCHDSLVLLDELAVRYDPARFAISLLNQYFPAHRAAEFPELNRRLTSFEYKKVVAHAQDRGFCVGFVQERSAAKEEYVPDFDY